MKPTSFRILSLYFLLVLMWLLPGQQAGAQDGGLTQTYILPISGAAFAVNGSAYLQYPAQNEKAFSIQNLVTLNILEEGSSYMSDNFTVSVLVKIDYGASSTTTTSSQQTLTVTYNKQTGTSYNAKNYISFNGFQYVKITILTITPSPLTLSNGVDPRTLLSLTNEMRVKRFFELPLSGGAGFPAATIFSQPLAASPVPDELPVYWQWPAGTGNSATQLEWTWLEDELNSNYLNTDGSLNYTLLFKKNATRVDLPVDATGYNIPLFYDGKGTLYYRIRAVNNKPSGNRSDGPWSAIQSYTFPGHNPNLNWQATTSYAEEGKRKSILSYFDGSLRQRQTVTKDNTTNTTLTAETFYDGQGRPAIQILPAPGINNIVSYTQNLNLFNGQTANTDPAVNFDLQPLTPGNSTPPLSTATGAALYYSAANPDIATDNTSKFLPNASGYPYTVTRYTPDATSRIQAQSGVGPAMGMGTGHETKYYYGNASQEELDGLFGTEVGDFSHYFKNMVKDANGQISVSYTDMNGHTIATALAGSPPVGISPVLDPTQYPGQMGSSITRNLLNNNSNLVKEDAIEAVNSILVPATTQYNFSYALNPASLQLPLCNSNPDVCYGCMYNLEISITDESGDQAPIVKKFDNISLTAGNSCASPVTPFKLDSYNGSTPVLNSNTVQFSETLLPGSYSIRKTLSLSQSALQTYRDQYLNSVTTLCLNLQPIIDSVNTALMATSSCNIVQTTTPCQSCMANLGATYSIFKTAYLANLSGASNPPSDAELHLIYTNDSLRCSSLCTTISHKLPALQSQMMNDMTPFTGQYAKDPSTVVMPTSMYNTYDIFSTTFTGQPFYKKPENSDGTPGYYYNSNGQVDPTIDPDGAAYTKLNSTNPTTFDSLFIPAWSASLLPHHPEYPRLVFAQQHLQPSYDWIDNFNQVGTFSSALSGNYTNSTGNSENSDPFFSVAPASYRSAMASIETGSYYSGLSLWQIAYGDVACKTIADPLTRGHCYANPGAKNSAMLFLSLSASQQDQAWNVFKGLYSAIRDSMVNDYIQNSVPLPNAASLISQGYILRFPTSISQEVSQYQWTGFSTTPGAAPNISFSDSLNYIRTNRCSSYIASWNSTLLNCPAVLASPNQAAILSEITAGMEQVCEKGYNESNPYGSSSVDPSTPADGTPRSFEDVVRSVFAKYGIAKDQYCSPYVFEFPKPYNKGPIFQKAVITEIDTCTCTQFGLIKQNATTAGYNAAVLSSLNTYLKLFYHDTLTQVLFTQLQQQCLLIRRVTCYDSSYVVHNYPCTKAGPDTCTATLTTSICNPTLYIALSSPQPKPAFLNCGYAGPNTCITCSQLSTFTDSFKVYFAGLACAAAPVISATNLTPAQISYNVTFAQYLNYKLGLQLTWQQYAQAANTAGCNLANYLSNGSASQTVVCPDSLPIADTTGMLMTVSPCQKVYDMAIAIGTQLYNQRLAQAFANFEASYRDKCLSAKSIEQFSVQYTNSEYHYTLYYYDQAGNLLKTVPPKGARPNFSPAFISSVETARGSGSVVTVPHLLTTQYRYNSLNQVIAQSTPDAGLSSFWYDKLGRLVVSQNALQAGTTRYSYTAYDALGRIVEVGQKPQSSTMSQTISQDPAALNNWLVTTGNTKEQVTYTVYDVNAYGMGTLMTQKNLRNRVSGVYTKNLASDLNLYVATFYSYDVQGNVDTLLQDYLGVGPMAAADQYKRICYDYDLVSGKVNGVDYQPGAPDAFYHRYLYDAENRLVQVSTSRDSIVWERDATYNYYKHGPLSSMTLGQLQIQQLGYSYTLQGWLKGVNIGKPGSTNYGSSCPAGTGVSDELVDSRPATGGPAQYAALNSITFEPGFTSGVNDNFATVIDGSLGACTTPGTVTPTQNYPIALDAYNFSLQYYKGDYTPVSSTVSTQSILESINSQAAPLFNGNIAAMAVNVPAIGSAKVYNYHYDQLNRLKQMDAFKGLNTDLNVFSPVQLQDYKEKIAYDPNGNILTYLRNGTTDGGNQLAMDNLTYNYTAGTNKLDNISDSVPAANYPSDIDNQSTGNYTYDAIGNLKADVAESITNINWNVYGKMLEVQRTATTADPNTDIQFSYDGAANRITKTSTGSATNVYVYVRDPQGNVLSVYQKSGANPIRQIEDHLYGSGRLGITRALTVAPQSISLGGSVTGLLRTFTRGEKSYELTNHLGNVLAALTDKKIAVPSATNSSLIDHYTADIASAQDYYPFGMSMPARTFTAATIGNYRYGFNGKENDNEVKGGTGEQIDYGMRVYDPRIGKFLSVDPITAKYPGLTPFQYASNSPIGGIDEDGLEWAPTKDKSGYNWVGYNSDGTAKSGSIASASISKGGFSYYYGSDAKTQTGFLDIFSNNIENGTGKASEIHDATADYNYNIKFTPAITGQAGKGYNITANAWRPNETTTSDVPLGLYNYPLNSQGYGDEQALSDASHTFGFGKVSPAIEAVYPETIFLPLPKLGLAGKLMSRLAFGATEGERLFWAGGGVEGLAYTEAMAYASKTGATTLEMTRAGRVLTVITEKFGMTQNGMKPWMYKTWKFASYHFANGARGTAHAFVDYLKANPNGVFFGTEKIALEKNGVDLIIHSVMH